MRVVDRAVSLVVVVASVSSLGCTSPHDCEAFEDWGTDVIVDDAGQDAAEGLGVSSFDAHASIDAAGEGDAERTSSDAETTRADASGPVDASGLTDGAPSDSGRRIGP